MKKLVFWGMVMVLITILCFFFTFLAKDGFLLSGKEKAAVVIDSNLLVIAIIFVMLFLNALILTEKNFLDLLITSVVAVIAVIANILATNIMATAYPVVNSIIYSFFVLAVVLFCIIPSRYFSRDEEKPKTKVSKSPFGAISLWVEGLVVFIFISVMALS